MGLLYIKNLKVSESGKVLLKDINLEVKSNTVIAVVGSDRATKLNFLRSLGHLDDYKGTRYGGTISINGKVIKSPNQIRKNLTYIYPQLFPGDIWENLTFALKLKGDGKAFRRKEKVESILEHIGQLDYFNKIMGKPTSSLKKVDIVLISLVRALTLEPKVILWNRPTQGLREIDRNLLESIIFKLREKYTVIFIARDMQQAGRLSEKVIFFYNGKFHRYDDTKLIFTNPNDPIIENYLMGKSVD